MRRLALAGVLLLSVAALADARVEARKAFKTGMALINDGQYDEGIEALLKAYRIKPHPNVLYNVAKAHQSAGRAEEAVTWYRRYLRANPQDSNDVRDTIEKLEASLPPKPPPEEPKVEPPPPTVTPTAPAVDPETLAKLLALTERLERAVDRAEASAPAGEEALLTPEEAAAPPPAAAEGAGANEAPYEETVVAASRRAQSTFEAPSATTIITGDEIRLSGLQTLPEILRRVPGAEVMTMGVGSSNVSFRGFNQRIANKVLVLIDGRPEYQDFMGVTMWPIIPIGVEEIDRIEVIRGPAGALYGANAMVGVVNIITRAPGSGPRLELNASGGNALAAGGSLVTSGGDTLKYRASAGYVQADKYSTDYEANRPDVRSNLADPALGLRSARGNLTLFYAFNKDVSVSASGGVNRLFTELYALGLLRNFFLDGLGAYAKADATLGPVKVRFFWNHTDTHAGPQYEPIGQPSLLTDLDTNVFDGEVLFQREFELFGRHLLGVGASSRLKRVKWGYLGPLRQELHAAAFVQDEWRILKPLSLVASYRIDRHPLLDNGNPGYAQSPRVSLVYSLMEGQAVRGSFATAFRQPTFLESYMDIRIPVSGIPGASVLTQGNRSLKPEQLTNFELGYRGEAARLGLAWELAAYWNTVENLVVLSGVAPVAPGDAFDAQTQTYLLGRSTFLNDSPKYTALGGEAGLTWNALSGLDLRASAAVQQISSSVGGVCGPCSQAPAVKLNGGFTWRTQVGLDLSADASYTSSTSWVEREPSPTDPTQILTPQNGLGDYVVLNARVGYRFWGDKASVAIVGTQLGPNHQEHPFGNDVSRRVFAQLTVTP